MTTRLETLPPELLYNVLSLISYEVPQGPHHGWKDGHALNAVAAVSPYLHDVVEEHARNLLTTHTAAVHARKNAASNATYDVSANAGFTSPTRPRGKATWCHEWLTSLEKQCWFCMKRSKRRAILDGSMVCCDKCDRLHDPKITMSAAMTNYKLSKFDLFTPSPLFPDLPPLMTGGYCCMGGPTIMILEADVVARSNYIDSLLARADADAASASPLPDSSSSSSSPPSKKAAPPLPKPRPQSRSKRAARLESARKSVDLSVDTTYQQWRSGCCTFRAGGDARHGARDRLLTEVLAEEWRALGIQRSVRDVGMRRPTEPHFGLEFYLKKRWTEMRCGDVEVLDLTGED